MENIVKYSDLDFAELNAIVSAFQKMNNSLLYCTNPCEYSIARWC